MDYRAAWEQLAQRTGWVGSRQHFSTLVLRVVGDLHGSGTYRDYTDYDVELLVLNVRYDQFMGYLAGEHAVKQTIRRKLRLNVPRSHVPGWLMVRGPRVSFQRDDPQPEDILSGVLVLGVHQDCRCGVPALV